MPVASLHIFQDPSPPVTNLILSWADSLWKVIDTIIFGQYFYIEADLTAYHTANYNETRWDDQFDIKQETYEYYIKTTRSIYNNNTQEMLTLYSETPPRSETATAEPVTLSYKSAELANVCLALTHHTYYPNWYFYREEY